MKKIAKAFAVFVAIALLGTAVSCNSSDDVSDPWAKGGPTPAPIGPGGGGRSGASWSDAELIGSLANTEYTWKEANIPADIAKRLQVGSKIIFEVEPKEDAAGEKYCKFRVTKGWTACGVSEYYTLAGDKIDVKEDADNPGTYENKDGNGGTYYCVVTAENLAKLQGGFDLVGNFKLIKIGITNLKAKEAEDPTVAKTITLEKNQYATNPESQAKVVLDFNKVKVGDKVTVKMKGKASKAFKGEFFIVDTTEAAGYWSELAPKYPADKSEGVANPLDVPVDFTIENVFEITKPQTGTGTNACMFVINAVDGDDTVTLKCTEYSITLTKGDGWNEPETPTGKTIDVAVNHYDGADHGIQYTEAVATCIPAGAKSGDVYTLKMVGTADAEFTANLLFVNGSWAGITGEAIPVTFTTTEFTIEKNFTFSADTDADCKFMLTNAEMSPAVAKKLTLKEYSFTKKGATPTPTPTGSYKAYTLTTNKAVKKDDVGLTFQYFVGAGETPVTVDITNLKVSLKVGDAAAVEKTFDSVKIEHHSWDANAAESNARVNLSLGSADEEIASGTTVVLQVLAATLSDATKADGITFALQQDGKHNEYDMLTAADSHPFAK